MWFDARDNECRGSLVNLAPGTDYEVQFNLPGASATRALSFRTWSNQLPIARSVTVNSGTATLNITEGGSASGYVLYEAAPGAVLDAQNAAPYNVSVNASFVIVRGLTLRGAQQDAIRISPNVKDVVIEDNDISGWGRTRDGTWGTNMDSAVHAVCQSETLERVTIQRNRIHDPRYSANSWSDGHPLGPQGVTISFCGGNHVIRHNEIYSTNGNRFNDAIGGEDNFTKTGFPNADSDIYGNRISSAWDDGIEAEGGNKNVRIWGNYLDKTGTGIATTATSVGPVYIFRNVFNRNEFYDRKPHDQDDRQPFFKSGSDSSLGNGRRYIFHNTMLQATEAGSSYGLGGGAGIGGTGNSQLINNTVSMNNIYHLWKPNSAFYQVGSDNVFQSDMYNGNAGAGIVNGINATPVYAAGNGWQSEAGGQYALAAGTPGYDQGTRIANFNDDFLGAAPDVGAVESGAPAMKVGLAAGHVPAPQPTTPVSMPTDLNVEGLWWRESESGWGVNLTQQGEIIFATLFTYDADGNGLWLSMSNGAKIGANTYSGALYRTTGPAFNSSNFDAAKVSRTQVGTATFSFSDANNGTFTWTVNGAAVSKPITRMVYAGPVPTCAVGGSAGATPNYQDLWWRSGGSESGWGVNITHQGDILFMTWFTYGADGEGMWLVGSNVAKTGNGTYSGMLHRTWGPPFNAQPWDPAKVTRMPVGSVTFSFSDAGNGTMTYTVEGVTQAKPITRLLYATPATVCR